MALITLALAPLALLLFLQIKFLPYHSEAITWLHRGLLALDLALVWTLWPGYRSGWGVRLWPKKSWWLALPGVLSAAALAYASMVATFPDERMYLATQWLHDLTYFDQITGAVSSLDRPNWYALIAPVNAVDLHGEDLIDDAKLAHIIEKNESSTGEQRWVASLPLAGRDLTGADLTQADIRQVDFSHAILNRANLRFAWAEEAHFDQAQLQGASLIGAWLQGASLIGAQLQGASLDGAQLQGAALGEELISGPRRYLLGVQLQGASLIGARLQGASVIHAELQGASLDHAQLQGASLNHAQLQGASFVDACVWRADAPQAGWKDTKVELPKEDKIHECDWTAASFVALKQLIVKVFPEGGSRRAAMERIEPRLDPTKALEGEGLMAEDWAARERETPAPEVYAKSRAELWRGLGCAAEGAPYVLHGLVSQFGYGLNLRYGYLPEIFVEREVARLFRLQSNAAKTLAAVFLDEAHCPGARGLSEADKAKLEKIAAPAAPPAPKP
jgi:uncharacterized protein YjbI with pentapeptide repeats